MAMVFLRMWVEPPLKDTGTCNVDGLGTVEVALTRFVEGDPDRPESEARVTPVGVLSCRASGLIGDDFDSQWTHLHRCFEVRALAEISEATVVGCRVEDEAEIGELCEWVFHAGLPRPLAVRQLPLGFPQQTYRNAPVPHEAREEAWTALSWFLRSLRTTDPFERMMLLWIALEALSPETKADSTCTRCTEKPVLVCPECGKPAPRSHRVRQAILHYCAEMPGVSKKELDRLYDFRSKAVHGRCVPGTPAATDFGLNVMRMTQIVIGALKREFGWPDAGPPSIKLEGEMHDSLSSRNASVFRSEAHRRELPVRIDVTPVRIGLPRPD